MLQNSQKVCKNLHSHQHNILLLQPSRRVAWLCDLLRHASPHFLAEYFAEALGVFATLCRLLQITATFYLGYKTSRSPAATAELLVTISDK